MFFGKTTKDIGNYGEKLAAKFLKKKGYKIVAKNFLSAHGEIDIIAKNRHSFVFVEVKSRKDCQEYFDSYGLPRDAVTKTKQKHIIYTAKVYLNKHPTDKEIRFDVIEVYLGDKVRIEHFENAFYQ